MNLGNAINKLLEDNKGGRLCIRSKKEGVNGRCVIYKGCDCTLTFARRQEDIIYPSVNFHKHVKNDEFIIDEVDEIDEKYIYEDSIKVSTLLYKCEKLIDNHGFNYDDIIEIVNDELMELDEKFKHFCFLMDKYFENQKQGVTNG